MKKDKGMHRKDSWSGQIPISNKDKGAQERSNICFSTEVSTFTTLSNFALIIASMRLQYDLVVESNCNLISVEPLIVGLLLGDY